MGKILQIQVRAWTYDEDEVAGAWPRLTGLVWPQRDAWAPPGSKHGVMYLVQALPDVLEFGNVPKEIKTALKPGAQEISLTGKKLETALADWQPLEANRLSDHLEDQLTALENAIPANDWA